MSDQIDIVGGAGPFEAAAVVAVVRHVLAEEEAARRRRPATNLPPAWVRAMQPHDPDDPLSVIRPDYSGDPMP